MRTINVEETAEVLSKRQEWQALVTVADTKRGKDPEGGKCKKVTGVGNSATDLVKV